MNGKPTAANPAPSRPPVLAIARIEAGRAVVADPAQAARLHAKGSVGDLAPNGALSLSLVEAALSVADGRLALMEGAKQLALADVLALGAAGGRTSGGHRTEMEYLVYRDLRERGLVVRPATAGRVPPKAAAGAAGHGRFAVWPRGTSQGDPAFHAVACADADGLPVETLAEAAADKSILSVADADGAVTHYQAALDAPAGDVPPGDLPRAKGAVLADRVLVSDPAAVAAYSSREFLGTRHGGELFLSFVEAESLRLRGVLSVPPGLAARGDSARLLPVHVALRQAGAVPKSGFKFGTHLRAYRNAPDDGHAEWLVHVADPGETLPWSALSRGVRLAHGVRKRFLVAIPGEAGHPPTFAQLSWYRP
jgi:tRNA-intron endonuclease